jgi:cytochrome c oxidase subunit 2
MNTLLLNLLATTDGVRPSTTWFPENASTDNNVDPLFYFIFWICAFFLVLNAGLMIYFAIRYRQRNKQGAAHGHTHNTAMEVTWSVIPAIILAIIFIWGFRGFLDMANPPQIAPEHEIAVNGYQWAWDFTYPNGETVKGMGTDKPALHVPAGVPVRLTLTSSDVLHSVFIPAFRVKKDVVPGRVTQLWFEPVYDASRETVELQVPNPENDNEKVTLRPNVYDLFCTEYCGQAHSLMITKVYVYSPEDYATWYASMSIISPDTKLVELGSNLYEQKCATCHTIDGSANTGPTWQNVYGSTRGTSAGAVLADDAYIIESIRNPGAKLVDGYGNNMSAFPNLTDREIRAIIEFMKTISDGAEANEDLTYGELNDDGTLKTEGEADGSGDGAGGGDAPAENE